MDKNHVKSRIKLVKGDITKVEVDAIVNAANSSLLGGGGVDGAIHKAGGSEILEQCRLIRNKQGGCKVGEAVITIGGKLKAKYVIHTVGPGWNGGKIKEEELLSNCYRNSLIIASDNKLKTIAFPSISTGIYKFPKEIAAKVAVSEVLCFLGQDSNMTEVIFVCFDDSTYNIYANLLEDTTEGRSNNLVVSED